MLDWMKRFLKNEESKNQELPETPQTEYEPVRYDSEPLQKEIEARVTYQYPKGKFRFPLEINEAIDVKKNVQADPFVRMEAKEAAPPVEKTRSRSHPLQTERVEQVQPVIRAVPKSVPQQPEVQISAHRHAAEAKRDPFRPTEVVSPIFGYTRPEEKQEQQPPPVEDIVLSNERKSVVDAWLEKNGYLPVKEEKAEPAAEETGQEWEEPVTEEVRSELEELKQDPVAEEVRAELEELSLASVLEEAEQESEEPKQDPVTEGIGPEPEELSPVLVLEETGQELEEPEQSPVTEEVRLEPEEQALASELEEAEQESEEPKQDSMTEEVRSEPEELALASELEEAGQESEEPKQGSVTEGIGQEPEELSPVPELEEAEQESEEPKQDSMTEEVRSEPEELALASELEEAEQELEELKQDPVTEGIGQESEELSPVPELEEAEQELEELKQDPVTEGIGPELEELSPASELEEAGQESEEPRKETNTMPAADAAETREEAGREPQPVQTEQREKKRFVPYNVMMLKQDRLRLNQEKPKMPAYTFPPIHLLELPPRLETNDEEWLQEQKELLNTTFFNFNVGAKVVHLTQGPSVTRFEVQPDPGVKVNKITNLSDDIKLNLAARDIRIEAPIPGKNAVGIEVPNKQSKPVFLREILRSPQFSKSESPLTVALGLDISGVPIVTDIRKMPHGLIAGSTGSGKSVCINAILTSILYKAMPHEVKLLLIDPKMVELAPYNEVPHLVSPVITDAKAATAALKWAVEEMERRYESFAHAGARDLTRYNDLVRQKQAPVQELPYIVIVIDELADLMMVAPGDVEEAICRIAQKARACGIHLLVATQRPSVDVITGLIKSNIPTRIAFTVSSQVDSRTIIDTGGAEKLLGRGDMLFLENGTSKTVRLQGVYVSDEEIERTVSHVKQQMKPNYLFQQDDLLAKAEQIASEDELFYDACQFVLEQGGASASSVQRRFRIGYNRAARLIEEMEAQGIISEARGTKPRDVLITEGELAAMQDINI